MHAAPHRFHMTSVTLRSTHYTSGSDKNFPKSLWRPPAENKSAPHIFSEPKILLSLFDTYTSSNYNNSAVQQSRWNILFLKYCEFVCQQGSMQKCRPLDLLANSNIQAMQRTLSDNQKKDFASLLTKVHSLYIYMQSLCLFQMKKSTGHCIQRGQRGAVFRRSACPDYEHFEETETSEDGPMC